MNVYLITDGIWPYVMGGMQKHSYYLAKYLAREKITVTVFYTTKNNDQISVVWEDHYSADELSYLTFIEVKYPASRRFPGHYIYESYLYSREVWKKFVEYNSTGSLAYIQGFSGWALMQKFKNKNLKTILNFHGLEMFQTPASNRHIYINAIFRFFVRKNFRLASYTQSLGGKLTEILLDNLKDSKKIIELGIGVSSDWLVGESMEKSKNKLRKFVFLGRYERRKGVEELNEVLIGLINKNLLNIQFEFIGPIPVQNRIDHSAIIYHGLVSEPSQIQTVLRNADILVCPSYSEGMPTVILEAMASGCAIIGTNVGAVRSQVSSDNGWLIEPANKAALEAAIIAASAISDDELMLMKRVSLEKVKRSFLWDTLIQKHIEAFDRIIKAR